jgi:hypothetical protein
VAKLADGICGSLRGLPPVATWKLKIMARMPRMGTS